MFLISLNCKFLAFFSCVFLLVGYSANALQCYNSEEDPSKLVDCKPDEEACVVIQKDSVSKTVITECRHQSSSTPDCEVVELPTEKSDVKQRWHYCYCKTDGCNTATVCYCGGMPPGEVRAANSSSSAAVGIHSKSKSTAGMIFGLALMIIIIIYKLFLDFSQSSQKGGTLGLMSMQN